MGQSLAIPRVIPENWKRLDLIVNKIKMRLGRDSNPIHAQLTLSKTCTLVAGLNMLRVTGLQTDGTAMTGTLRGAYIDVSNGNTAATGTIRGMELKARTEAPGNTGNDVTVLEGLSISADSKGHSVTTMRGAEFILDGSTGGTITEAVGLRIANNLQANKATISYGLQIYRDSFDYTYDISLSLGGHITGDCYASQDYRVTASPTFTGLTTIGNSVFGLNSSVFQPTADSITFFKILDAAGTPLFNANTTGRNVNIKGIFSLSETTNSSAPNPSFSKVAHGGISRLLINPASGNAKMNCFFAPSGTQDESSFQMRNDSDPNNAARMIFSVDGTNAVVGTGNFGSGYTAITNLIIGEETGKTGLEYISFAVPGGTERLKILSSGNIGINETAPETLLEMKNTEPYLTLHNSTHEDADGGRESRLIFKGEQSGGEETSLAQIEVSHDSAVDDQLGKIVLSVNTGAGLAQVLEIGSDLLTTFAGAITVTEFIKGLERSSDPTEPSEGEFVMWLSDGTGYGDDGDICIASQAAGTTKKAILFDHSAGDTW